MELSSKAVAIDDGDRPTARVNKADAFQQVDGVGHARPPNAQHDRQEFVRQGEGVAIGPVVRHQNPARQSLLDLAPSVGHGGIAGLHEERVGVEQERPVQGCALTDRLAQLVDIESPPSSGRLNIGVVGDSDRFP